jgi:hypothetical protein
VIALSGGGLLREANKIEPTRTLGATMSRVRFHTANALFEAFPELSKKISTPPSDQLSIDYLRGLISTTDFKDALTFCAYLLPRREAVWWACGCVRDVLSEIQPPRSDALLAAEAWVSQPDNDRRQAALDIGTQGNEEDPITWLARGAGWSGGFLFSHPQRQVPMPPYMTPRAIRVALLLAISKVNPNEQRARVNFWITEGIKLAETGL